MTATPARRTPATLVTGVTHTPVSTDDGNACTTDGCNPATGVTHTPVSTDDGNACTTDSCNPATGVTHTPVSIDDGNACTTDSCNPATGVTHTPVSIDDGNACTTDSCNPATGVSHSAPLACPAPDQCHDQASCNPATGVCPASPAKANGTSCNDGNANTSNDVCTNGTCAGTPSGGGVNLNNMVSYNGYYYATLDDAPADAAYGAWIDTCQNTSYLAVPAGWELAPEDASVVSNVIAQHIWSTHCILFSNGVSYGVSTYNNGGACGCSGSQCIATSGNTYQVTSCSRRILIRRPIAVALPAGCVKASDNTVWCATQSLNQTGAQICGYPAGYAGTYYAITAAGAAALGQQITGYGDCATNYYNPGGGIQGWNGSSCWTPEMQWGRSGANSTGVSVGGNVVRCTNLEGGGPCAGQANGTACDDGNANTVGDVCTNGACAGIDHCVGVVCAASDQCHTAGTCIDHATGACSNPVAANGTSCNDGNGNTSNDVCTNGTCAGTPSGGGGGPLPAGCVKASDNTVWCATQSLNQTGAQICGYPAGYAGTYYAITAAGAAALGQQITGYGDCATNYYNPGGGIQGWNGSSCWTPEMQWGRSGANSTGVNVGGNVVRCTNLEGGGGVNLNNMVSYNGYYYATLDDAPADAAYGAWIDTCQNSSYLAVPAGWELAPEDASVVSNVIAQHVWSTHCILFSNGVSYGVSTYNNGGACGCSGSQCIATSGNTYQVTSCSRRILIRRPIAVALPAGCVKASDNTVWCATQSLNQTGAQICGYPAGYAGTYYAITAAGAAALGQQITGYGDCATNYYNPGGGIQGWNGSSCWTADMQWGRSGSNSTGVNVGGNVVRCTNLE
jgi:cytochrome b involved in lipid metabolism